MIMTAFAGQGFSLCPVGMCHRKIMSALSRTDHRCSGPVAKQDAGSPVAPVGQIGKAFTSDHQSCLVHAAFQVSHSRVIPQQKSGTGRIEVETCGMIRPQYLLHLAGRTGKDYIGRNGRYQDQIHILRIHARIRKRKTPGFSRHRHRSLFLNDVAPHHAGPLPDPLVAGLH